MTGQGKNAIDVVLAESLKELAATRPIEKITIKEITDRAGVIRPTFYNHFQDKYELMEWIIRTELLAPMIPLIQADMIKEAMKLLFTNIYKEKTFYSRAIKLEGQVSFHEIAMRCVKDTLLEAIKKRASGKPPKYMWLTPEVIAAYYAQSMCFAAEGWIQTGMLIPVDEMAEAYQYIMSRSMEDLLKEM